MVRRRYIRSNELFAITESAQSATKYVAICYYLSSSAPLGRVNWKLVAGRLGLSCMVVKVIRLRWPKLSVMSS